MRFYQTQSKFRQRLQNTFAYTMPAILVSVCALLILCAQTALESARDALSLWWNQVLPALFPFYVLTTLLDRCGTLAWLNKKFGTPLLPCFLFGMLGGYPTGARIAKLLGCEDAAKFCNLCSPMFLMGVVAVGMCGNARIFYPLALAHYGSAALMLGLNRMSRFPLAVSIPAVSTSAQEGSVLNDIAGGMQIMLTIGGCIVFFYVPVNTLLGVVLHNKYPLLAAFVVGCTELTSGCRLASCLALPTSFVVGLLAFFVSFGGICVFAQAMLVGKLRRPALYLTSKAMQACLAAILAYTLTPVFVRDSVHALADTMQSYKENALMGVTFFVSASVGLAACYLLALVLRRNDASFPSHT